MPHYTEDLNRDPNIENYPYESPTKPSVALAGGTCWKVVVTRAKPGLLRVFFYVFLGGFGGCESF